MSQRQQVEIEQLAARIATLEAGGGGGGGDEVVFRDAGDFSSGAGWGSPSLTGAGFVTVYGRYWLMSGTASEGISTRFIIPDGWTTAEFRVHWFSVSSSGDIYFQYFYSDDDAGNDRTAGGSSSTAYPTAAATNIMSITANAAPVSVTPGASMRFSLVRPGNDASDTHSGDIGVCGVSLHKIT